MKTKKVSVSPTVANDSAKPELDLSNMPVEIGGKTYSLSFEFGALAEAERFFKRQGHRASLILALPDFGLESIREVFACAAHAHHPELTWEAAQALVTIESMYPVATLIQQAWNIAEAKNAVPAAK
jgi:hypothetical protein